MAKNKKPRKRNPQKKAAAIMRLIGIRDKSKEYLGHIEDIHAKSIEGAQIINTKLQIMTLSFLNPETRGEIIETLGLTDVLKDVKHEDKKLLARELYKTIVLMSQLRKSSDKLLTDEMNRLNTIINEAIPPLLTMTAKEIPLMSVEEIGLQVMDSKMNLDKYSLHSQFIFSFANILTQTANALKEKGITFLEETIKAHGKVIADVEMQDKLVGWMRQEGLDDFFSFCEPYEKEFQESLHEEEKKSIDTMNQASKETTEETDIIETMEVVEAESVETITTPAADEVKDGNQ